MRKFGLIGFPLTHSFSRKYFTDLFSAAGIQATYENYPLEKIDYITPLFGDPLLEGINVTIPYKESVLAYLDDVTEAVKEIGACNCIHIQDGRKIGYNTDVIGFERTLERKLKPSHQKALVLGTGGAAKAVCFVLKKKNISYLQVSRNVDVGNITYSSIDAAIMRSHTLIINTTPLGMYPLVSESPAIPYDLITEDHYCFDLIYNPKKTLFLKRAEDKGAIIENGEEMLIIQANESRKIWRV